jgi:hypothetical protein
MTNPLNYPLFIFAISFLVLWLSAKIGMWYRTKRKLLEDDSRKDFDIVLTSTLTLLSLIVGFTFSMAIGRYDQRKNYEEQEANAIGTEYVRLDILPASDAAKVKTLLVKYLDERILFYQSRNWDQLQRINADTAQIQDDLWSAVKGPAVTLPNPVTALSVAGMNDVLNSQGYTQAAWWNRIPIAAWILLGIIAICASLAVGYNIRGARPTVAILVLPLTISTSFFLIADIDSPRNGVIRIRPQNLISLSQSLHGTNR